MLKSMLFGGKLGQGDPWVATLSDTEQVKGQSVAVASDGSVYVCGYANTYSDLLIVKYDSLGNVQWKKRLGDDRITEGYSVAVAPDESIYVCGYSELNSKDKMLIAKFTSAGDIKWQKVFSSRSDSHGFSVSVAPDGSVYACGDIVMSSGRHNLLLAKFDSSGSVQWQAQFYGDEYDCYSSIAVAPDGSVYVCGETDYSIDGNAATVILKLSSDGALKWGKVFGGSRYENNPHLAVAPDGSVYVCGNSSSTSVSGVFLVKFDPSGKVKWQKLIADVSLEFINKSISIDTYGYVYVCGYTDGNKKDIFLLKFDSSGKVQWKKTLTGSERIYGEAVTSTLDGSIYACGYTFSPNIGQKILLIAKITDEIIWKDKATFGDFNWNNASFTIENISLTVKNWEFTYPEPDLSLEDSYLSLYNPSLTATLYTESE